MLRNRMVGAQSPRKLQRSVAVLRFRGQETGSRFTLETLSESAVAYLDRDRAIEGACRGPSRIRPSTDTKQRNDEARSRRIFAVMGIWNAMIHHPACGGLYDRPSSDEEVRSRPKNE